MEAITERQQIITEELFEFKVSQQEGVFSQRLTEGFPMHRATTRFQLAVASVPDKDSIKAREKT